MSVEVKEEMKNEKKSAKQVFFSVSDLTAMALFAAMLCISAYISIPLPLPGSPHITLLNFMILLIALVFPLKQSVCTILVWLLLGVLGVPVFIGGGSSFGYLVGPWGGYTFSFLIIAILLPLVRGKGYNRIIYTIVSVAGALLIDAIGMVWLKTQANYTWAAAFSIGFLPFLPLDLVKAVVVAQIVPLFRKVLKRQ